jgi:hypothetical protein
MLATDGSSVFRRITNPAERKLDLQLDIRPTDRRHQTILAALLRWICNPALILVIKTELKISFPCSAIFVDQRRNFSKKISDFRRISNPAELGEAYPDYLDVPFPDNKTVAKL